MIKRILSLCLLGSLLLSLSTPAMAVRAASGSGQPKSATGTTAVTPPASDTLSFDQIESLMRSGNLNILAALEGLAAAEAFDRDAAYKELANAIDDLEDAIQVMTETSNTILEKTVAGLGAALEGAMKDLDFMEITLEGLKDSLGQMVGGSLIAIGNAAATKAYLMVQIDNMQATVDAMKDQLDNLTEENFEKNLTNTRWQVQSTIAQIVTAGQSLYVTILSTQLQLETLNDTLASTKRTLEEMELRYQLGQISQLNLLQVQQGYESLEASVGTLGGTISTMKGSLQSLLGQPATGTLTLEAVPFVTQTQLDAISYNRDLAAAKEASYTVYSADQTLEDATETWKDAQKEHSKTSYQYAVALHTYQSAVYQHDAAIQGFESAFRSLYSALAPAQSAVTTAESALAYQQKVYDAQALKYQQGNLSHKALLDAQDTLNSAKREVTSAKLELFTAYQNYQNGVKFGLVSSVS